MTTTATNCAAAFACLGSLEAAAELVTEGTAFCTSDQLAGWYAFDADRAGNGDGLAGVNKAGIEAHLGFLAEAGAEFDENDALKAALSFAADAKAEAALEKAIAAYEGDTGPGRWIVSEASTQGGPDGVSLTYKVAEGKCKDGSVPWEQWGGNAILEAAGLMVLDGVDDNDDAGTVYCSVIVTNNR